MMSAYPQPPPQATSPPPSPPPPALPDTSPPHSPPPSPRSPSLPSPPHSQPDQFPTSPPTSSDDDGEDESDESYFTSDSDGPEENVDIRRPKVSTTSCYEVNASPKLSGREDHDGTSRRIQSSVTEIHSSRRGSHAIEDRSSRRGSATPEGKSSRRGSGAPEERSLRRGSAARVKKKKKRTGPRVSKYKENTRTVRQHIKPGTVEDLATLFTGWRNESEENENIVRSSTSLNNYEAGHGSVETVNMGNGEQQQQQKYQKQQQQPQYQPQYQPQQQRGQQRKRSEGKMDFIAASKVIQERLILSRNNSLHRPSTTKADNGVYSNVPANDIKADTLNYALADSTHSNNGPDYEVSVTKANTKSSQSFEGRNMHERGHPELERTNMTNGLQTNNEHESKHKHLPGDGTFNLIMSKGGESVSSGHQADRLDTQDWPTIKSKNDKDINKVMASRQHTYEPISIDNITLSERNQAAHSHTSTQSSTGRNYSNDLQPSRHSHAINNDILPIDNPIKAGGLDDTDLKHDRRSHVYSTRTTREEMKTEYHDVLLESKGDLKTMASEIDSGVSEENNVDRSYSGGGWDSVSSSTGSVKDSDGQSVTKGQDDVWITVDVPPFINGFDSDDVTTTNTSMSVHNGDDSVGTSDVNGVLGLADDQSISLSQTNVSKNDTTASLDTSDKVEAVTKPLENTFVTEGRPNQPEHSANVNMQLLKNLQSQTREGSRPDLFAHSSRVWGGVRSGDGDGDDGDGGGEGGEGGREGGMMEAVGQGQAVITGDIQTNKRPSLLHSQTRPELEDHNNSLVDSGEDIISTRVDSRSENVGDDFLSVLDDIHIDTDTTSYFLKNRNKLKSVENRSSKVSDSDNNNKLNSDSGKTDDLMSENNKKRDNSEPENRNVSVVVTNESHQSTSVITNSSDGNNNSLQGHSKLNIEEELQELHRKLSPQSSLKDPIVKDTSDFDSRNRHFSTSSSSLTSVSSSQSGIKSDRKKSKNSRETSFNVDFFTTSTEEKEEKELETSRSDAGVEVGLEVDQVSTSSTTPVSKNIVEEEEEVILRQRKVGREESDARSQHSNQIPEDDSKTKPIIASRESFRSVRGLFESDKEDKDITQRTQSINKRHSLNLERQPSDSSKKWRRSGSSWTVDESVVSNVNHSERSGVVDSNDRSSDSVSAKADTPRISSTSLGSSTVNKQELSNESTMAAVVGKVSSFNIHKRGTPHQESPNISSSQAGSNNSDVYLIQDNSGDVYALQEVNTTQPGTQHTYGGDNYTHFDTSKSSQHTSYHQPTHRNTSADLYVDGSGINDSKAKEVISAYLSTDPNQSNTMSRTHTYNTKDESFSSSSITNNPHSIVVHQGEDTGGGGGYVLNNSVNTLGHGYHTNNNLLNNSTIAIDTQVDGRFDTSQTWSSSHNEPYTIGGGGENGYKSSLVVTNFNTPNQRMYSSHSNSPSVDTSLDSQYHNGGNVMRGSHSLQSHQPLMVNVNHDDGSVSPFRTTPVTVQTTTSAVVGEHVGMKIDFPIIEQPQVTTTAELAHSSSDDENRKHYVIKSVAPKKSSLKISRDNDTSLGSNSDLIYTKRESLTGDIIIGGNRKTVIDNRSDTNHSSKTYVTSNASHNDRGRTKTKVSGKVKHHSPERYFKNAQLSLKRDKNDSSDEDAKKYRTVTRVVLESDNVDNSYSRSGSESPQNHYRVVNNQSSSYQDNSLSEDDQYYEVSSRRSEFDTRGKRRRYKVVNASHDLINSDSVRAHSSPKPYTSHSKSFEENYVTKLEHKTTPSHYKTLPANSKRHKTVIQLDLDNSGIKEKGRSESEFSAPSSRIYRTKSVDSLSSGLKVFQSNDEMDSRRMWRTGRARSVGSSSDESSSDFEGSGPYNLTPTLVNTSKQKRGNKTYVVKSTVDDHRSHSPGWFKSTIDINEKHPDRSHEQNYVIQSTNSSSQKQSFSQSERITQQRSDVTSSQATEKSVYYVRESAQPSYTQIPIQASPDSGRGTEFYSSDGENESTKKKFERVERIYEVRTEPELPEQFLDESVSTDMRVLRGKILIQNKMDDSSHFEDEFEQNVNMFDNSFHLGKDNPLYASDSDLMAALEREERQEMSKHVTQDITYDKVDSMSHKYKTSAKAEISSRPKRKQNLSTLLLSKLANVDSKDIRQTINVEHHNEDIVGDINFIHADGKKSGSHNTSNFDSVTENVELTLQQGKAFVIIKVIAERIIPTDLEFNIWRKSQAIVTRQIEIDLLANDQRRRFYHHVMETQGRPSLEGGSSRGHASDMGQERQLNSMETLKLFSRILDIADGQGDKDHTTMSTKQEMGQLPSGADLLY